MRRIAQPEFTCSNLIELTSTMYKINKIDTRKTSFDVFLMSIIVNVEQILHRVSTAHFEQVNSQWLEGSIILIGNDVLPR